MIKFRITLQGTTPLLMHNSALANPMGPVPKAMKALSSKRTKADEDYEAMAELEFAGGLYFDPKAGPYLPADNIHASLLYGAKKTKNGPKIKEGVFITTDVNPLAYQGPRTIDALWADENFRHFASVKVGMSRVQRCRPVFGQWACEAEGIADPALIDLPLLASIADTAGSLVGIGDWRPRFGRYEATIEKI